ncbi:MAG: SIMPL domain-containing protein [Thermodesulfobacteriota bacterium]
MIKQSILILLAMLLAGTPSGFAQSAHISDRNLVITDGTAEVSGQNDSARLSFAVVTEGDGLEPVSADNDAKTRAVLQAVKGLGIETLKLETSSYRVTPQRDYKARPPRIKGYEVFNAVEATLEGLAPEQLSKIVTKIIGKALDSGANSVQSVQFYIRNREGLEKEALKLAVEQAVERAKTMAAAAGVKLRHIVSLSTQPFQTPRPHILQDVAMKSAAAEASPPMEVGESRVRVQVSIMYEIEP